MEKNVLCSTTRLTERVSCQNMCFMINVFLVVCKKNTLETLLYINCQSKCHGIKGDLLEVLLINVLMNCFGVFFNFGRCVYY